MKITASSSATGFAGLPFEATVAMADVAGAMRDGLLAFSAAAGLVVMQQMLTAELTGIVGEKHAKLAADVRVGNWHGTTNGAVVLGGRKVTVERPRGRYVDGGEVELATWDTFASDDLLRQVVVERMLAGVATRRYVDVAEPVGKLVSKGLSKSAVSRRFVTATEAAMKDLLARDLSELTPTVLMVDGLNVADQMIVVAMVITADGTKIPAGLILGDTENTVVVTDLLADLVARGLRFEHGILVVLDGSKALRKAVAKVFGDKAVVQRCTLHKRRNVIGYLPANVRDLIDRRLALAFAQPDPAKGLKACRDLAVQLDKSHPDAAGSLREGLEEMFTVARLGVPVRLRRTLTNTNCIESMISIVRTTSGRVKNWGDGKMRKRWIAVGMLEAERSFRRCPRLQRHAATHCRDRPGNSCLADKHHGSSMNTPRKITTMRDASKNPVRTTFHMRMLRTRDRDRDRGALLQPANRLTPTFLLTRLPTSRLPSPPSRHHRDHTTPTPRRTKPQPQPSTLQPEIEAGSPPNFNNERDILARNCPPVWTAL